MIKFLWIRSRHKWFVFLAGLKIGGIPLWRLLVHDFSAFSFYEAPAYADRAKHDGHIRDRRAWAYAWLHHQNHCPHHWEYWTFAWHSLSSDINFYDGIVENGCLEMPNTYVREMVADWMGASRVYTGSWDMLDWLNSNFRKMQVHPSTSRLVRKTLAELKYIYDRETSSFCRDGILRAQRRQEYK